MNGLVLVVSQKVHDTGLRAVRLCQVADERAYLQGNTAPRNLDRMGHALMRLACASQASFKSGKISAPARPA
jgi:hypothetical protein